MSDNKQGKAKAGEELTFVVTTNPYDHSSAANKRRVRSVAALRSWPERRKKTFENVDQSDARGGFVLDLPDPPPPPPVRPAVGRSDTASKKRNVDGPPELVPELQKPREDEEEPLFETCTRAFNDYCSCIHCRSERTYLHRQKVDAEAAGSSSSSLEARTAEPATEAPSQSRKRTADGEIKSQSTAVVRPSAILTPPASPLPSPVPFINNQGRAEPFNCYPVPYRPWFDRILHHMMTVFAPRGWPALKITNPEGLHWEWFMTQHALAEPALFYVRLLFASGDLIRLQALTPEISYWLQAQAITAINEALSDPKRATSDPLILAVGRIALHEALYGNKEAASTMHRPAQARMIRLRGGMRALPFPPLVKRLMRWADNVMGMRSGTGRMLEDDEEEQNFAMKESVDVLEKWVPTEGQELRKKIKISDLLSPQPP